MDVLVNAGSAVTLQGNPDIAQLIIQPEQPGIWATLKLFWRIFRRYDLAVCTLYNDRPQLYALAAAPLRASVIPPPNQPGAGWKRRLSKYSVMLNLREIHAAEQYLRLADAMQIPRMPEVVPPHPPSEASLDALLGAGWRQRRYVVLHPAPMYRYKAWTAKGWQALIAALRARGLEIMITGGPGTADRQIVDAVLSGTPPEGVTDLAGRLKFSELTPLIERAQLFVGPDTSVTHLASATGVPTITLFGPSNPVAWGPWPQGYAAGGGSPWVKIAPVQHHGNVWIVQGASAKGCVPCLKEGCERHLNSRADCLDELPASRVLEIVERIPSSPESGPDSRIGAG